MTTPTESPRTAAAPLTLQRYTLYLAAVVGTLLLIPLVAMQFTAEVDWSPFDFFAAAFLLGGAGIAYKLIADRMPGTDHRRGVGIAVGTSLLLMWINLAVGIIGSEDHPANLMYPAVLVVGFMAAALTQFRPHALMIVSFAVAGAILCIPVIAFLIWYPEVSSGLVQVFILNMGFAAMYIVSAQQFRAAVRQSMESGR